MAVTINGNGTVTGLTALPDSAMSSGSIIQQVSTNYGNLSDDDDGTTSTSYVDTGISQTITPSSGTEQMQFDANGLTLQAQNDLRFADADSSHYVGFQAPATVSSSLTWTLPSADAAVSGYALVSDASGTLSWAAAGAGAVGGGGNEIFWENDQTVTQNYTITNGKNAGSFGPIEIQSGATVTVGAGETWTIV